MPASLLDYWPLVVAVGGLILALILAWGQLGDQRLPYVRRSALLSDGELAFYRALREAVRDDWTISPMVRMADLIRVRPQTPKSQTWRNRISGKHIDFVLCDRESMELRLALELDDRSHRRADRVERDRFVDTALEAAGLPLLRVTASGSYDPGQLRQQIEERLGGSSA